MASEQVLLQRLDESRREMEERLGDLRRTVDRELGTLAPRRAAWLVPLVGFAAGIALAALLRKSR